MGAVEGDAAGVGFGGELGFDFGLEIEVDHAKERIALGLGGVCRPSDPHLRVKLGHPPRGGRSETQLTVLSCDLFRRFTHV